MKAIMLLALAAALALSGCQQQAGTDGPGVSGPPATAASQQPTAAPTPQVMTPGRFTFTTAEGATGTLQVPAPAVQEIEELRALVQGEPVDYITVNVDNRKGTRAIYLHLIELFGTEGRQYTYTSVPTYLDMLRDKLPQSLPSETNNRFADISNQHIDGASPLEVKDFVLVGEKVPGQFAGISVYPAGTIGGPVQVTPAK